MWTLIGGIALGVVVTLVIVVIIIGNWASKTFKR